VDIGRLTVKPETHMAFPFTIARAAAERRNGHAVAPPPTASVLGLGHYLPAEVLSTRRSQSESVWTPSGSCSAPGSARATPGERLAELTTHAGREALSDAGIGAGDVDLVLVATLNQDEVTPNAAPLVTHALGVPT
jgi:3-oxoacyl-[acyl-carrier-protein] synthase-3